jgi:RHS repeat-associated protein
LAQGPRQVGFAYDNANRLTSVTDATQRTVQFLYDASDHIIQETLPDGRTVGFTYDANGNITSITPPSRPAHSFSSTPVDLEAIYAPPAVTPGGATLYAYNRDRQLTRIDRPDNRSLLVAYDSAGRPSSLSIGRGTIGYSWEAGTGRLLTATAPDGGTVSFGYDGALPTDAKWSGSIAGSMAWTYDNRFNLASEIVKCATTTTLACRSTFFRRDADNLLTGAGPLVLSRDPQNGLLTDTKVGQITDQWSYNAFGDPTSYTAKVSGTSLFSQQYTRDALGRITSQTETVGSATSTFGYSYDTAGHLTDVKVNGTPSSSYTYDNNGNRLTHVTPSGTESATIDAQDRLLTSADAVFTYTANGDLATKTDRSGKTIYDYDELGNLLSVVLPNGQRIEYVIDATNHRIGKKIDGVLAQRFVYGNAMGPSAELDTAGNVVARFIYVTRANVADVIIKGDTTYRVVTDQLGSPRLIVNAGSGAVVEAITYDEFGNVLSDSNPGFQPFGFAGGLFDRDTGLTHFGARDYDPQRGRWTAKDPVAFVGQDSNLYAYAYSDPINYIDTSGLWGFGVNLGEATEIGIAAGAAQQGSAGFGVFGKGFHRPTVGGFLSWGGFAGPVRGGVSYPRVPEKTCDSGENDHFAFGAFAGGGANAFLTNATSVKDLGGPFTTLSINLAAGLRTLGLQVSYGRNDEGRMIVMVNYGGPLGIPAPTGAGFGVSASGYQTNTWTKEFF